MGRFMYYVMIKLADMIFILLIERAFIRKLRIKT